MPFLTYHEKPDADRSTSTGEMQVDADVFFQYVSDHDRYKAALSVIASEELPDGVKPKYLAAFVLWGAKCDWCKGFNHPEAWIVGCQCKEDEPWT